MRLSKAMLDRRYLLCRAAVTAIGATGFHRRNVAAQEAAPVATPVIDGAYATVNGTELYFVDTGEPTGPPVLFLHGGLGSSENWALVWPLIAQAGYRVVLLDSRKHGRSGWNDDPITYEQFAADAVGLLDALGIETTNIVGWSDGAITALQFATTFPDRLERAVVYGANVTPDGFIFPEESPALEAFIAQAAEDFALVSPAPGRFGDLYLELRELYETAPNFSDTQLHSIAAPILVLDGANEELIAPDQPMRIAESIPNAQLVIMPGVGHFAPLEQPEEFALVVLSFLTE